MAEELFIPQSSDRKERYSAIIPQIASLIEYEEDLVANLANTAAVLKEAFGFFWVGFYLVKDDELVLGPFQGPLACTRIARGKGVCGTSWEENRSLLVPDVEAFPGHIACSSLSRSEVVIPIPGKHGVSGVLDVDSDQLDDFTEADLEYLEKVVALLAKKHFN